MPTFKKLAYFCSDACGTNPGTGHRAGHRESPTRVRSRQAARWREQATKRSTSCRLKGLEGQRALGNSSPATRTIRVSHIPHKHCLRIHEIEYTCSSDVSRVPVPAQGTRSKTRQYQSLWRTQCQGCEELKWLSLHQSQEHQDLKLPSPRMSRGYQERKLRSSHQSQGY